VERGIMRLKLRFFPFLNKAGKNPKISLIKLPGNYYFNFFWGNFWLPKNYWLGNPTKALG